MTEQHRRNIIKFEKQVSDLSNALANLNSPDDWKQLIIILHRPGWTTIAEMIFVSGILDMMLAQVAALTKLKSRLMKGSEAVSAK